MLVPTNAEKGRSPAILPSTCRVRELISNHRHSSYGKLLHKRSPGPIFNERLAQPHVRRAAVPHLNCPFMMFLFLSKARTCLLKRPHHTVGHPHYSTATAVQLRGKVTDCAVHWIGLPGEQRFNSTPLFQSITSIATCMQAVGRDQMK